MKLTKLEKYTKEFYWLQEKIVELQSIEIASEIDDILGGLDNYSFHIGNYDLWYGFHEDYSIDKNMVKHDGISLINYLIEYHENKDFNVTSKLFIAFYDIDNNYNEYYIEYNGYELFNDYY